MKKLCTLETVPGFTIATVSAGIRDWKQPRDDMALIVSDAPVATAGVFTQNQIAAAPVKIDKKHLKASGGIARAILVNAGVANACTGDVGKKNALKNIQQIADRLDIPVDQVLVASTGVIGRHLPMDSMEAGIDQAFAALGKARAGDFSRAIMTTDIRPKEASLLLDAGEGIVMAGACKGSGMIAPNMATMLAFVLTNAAVAPGVLKEALKEVADATFNMVSVDGDQSTNDSLFVMASGTTDSRVIDKASGKSYDKFLSGLYEVSMSLSRQIAIDGEGATKLVRILITGAQKHKDAIAAARSIAQSPLVKTAMFGNDPNWGRIICALGYSEAKVDESCVSMSLCGQRMFAKGVPVIFDTAKVSTLMQAKEIDLEVDLGLGDGEALMLTCDFSYDYVKINADYTT